MRTFPLIKYVLQFGIEEKPNNEEEKGNNMLRNVKSIYYDYETLMTQLPKLLNKVSIYGKDDEEFKRLIEFIEDNKEKENICSFVFPSIVDVHQSVKGFKKNCFEGYVKKVDQNIEREEPSFHSFPISYSFKKENNENDVRVTYYLNCLLYWGKASKEFIDQKNMKKETIYICKAISFVTDEPCFGLCNKILREIYSKIEYSQNNISENSLVKILSELRLSKGEINKISITPNIINDYYIHFSHLLPTLDLNLAFFFEFFTLDETLYLIYVLIQNKPLFVISDEIGYLLPIYQILTSFCHPFNDFDKSNYTFSFQNTYQYEIFKMKKTHDSWRLVFQVSTVLPIESDLWEMLKDSIDCNEILDVIIINKKEGSCLKKQFFKRSNEEKELKDFPLSKYPKGILQKNPQTFYNIYNSIEQMINQLKKQNQNKSFYDFDSSLYNDFLKIRSLFFSLNCFYIKSLKDTDQYDIADISYSMTEKDRSITQIFPFLQNLIEEEKIKSLFLCEHIILSKERNYDFLKLLLTNIRSLTIDLSEFQNIMAPNPQKVVEKSSNFSVKKRRGNAPQPASSKSDLKLYDPKDLLNYDLIQEILPNKFSNPEKLVNPIFYSILYRYYFYIEGKEEITDLFLYANICYTLVAGIFLMNNFNPFRGNLFGFERLVKSYKTTKSFGNQFLPNALIIFYISRKFKEIYESNSELGFKDLKNYNIENKNKNTIFLSPLVKEVFQRTETKIFKKIKEGRKCIKNYPEVILGVFLIDSKGHIHYNRRNVIFDKDKFTFRCGYCNENLGKVMTKKSSNELSTGTSSDHHSLESEIFKPSEIFGKLLEEILKKGDLDFKFENELTAFGYPEWKKHLINIYFYGQFLIDDYED